MSFINPRTLIRDLAGAIIATDRFARNGSGMLFVYRDGVYRPDGDMFIRKLVKHLLIHHDCSEVWSRRLAGEIVEFITLDVPELPERPSIELINVENGFLNVRTRQLFPHSPDLLSTNRIPVTYDPQAQCPEIERFIGEVFPEEAIPLAWEILGDLLTPAVRCRRPSACWVKAAMERAFSSTSLPDSSDRTIYVTSTCSGGRWTASRLHVSMGNWRTFVRTCRPSARQVPPCSRPSRDAIGSRRR